MSYFNLLCSQHQISAPLCLFHLAQCPPDSSTLLQIAILSLFLTLNNLDNDLLIFPAMLCKEIVWSEITEDDVLPSLSSPVWNSGLDEEGSIIPSWRWHLSTMLLYLYFSVMSPSLLEAHRRVVWPTFCLECCTIPIQQVWNQHMLLTFLPTPLWNYYAY